MRNVVVAAVQMSCSTERERQESVLFRDRILSIIIQYLLWTEELSNRFTISLIYVKIYSDKVKLKELIYPIHCNN